MRNKFGSLLIFIIIFMIVYCLHDYTFKLKVNEIIKENPNITLQEFMGGEK